MSGAQAGTVSADLVISEESLAKFNEAGANAAQQVGKDLGDSLGKGAADGTDQASSSVNKLGSTIAKVAGAAVLAKFFAGAVEGAEAAEVRTRQIEAAITATGNAANTSIDQINGMASSLSEADAVSAGVIKSADLILLKFTNIKNVGSQRIFDEATKSTLDLAAGMGIDVPAAAELLGKALNNPIAATRLLTQAGIALTQAEKDKIKALVESGDVLDAQSLILDKVNQRFAGQAAAAVTPLARLHVELGKFSTSIGQGMLPFVDAGTSALTGIIKEFEKLPQPVQSALALFGTGAYVVGAFGQQIVAAKELLAPIASRIAAAASALSDYVTEAISGQAASEGLTGAFTTQAAAEYEVLAAQTGVAESALLASVGNESLAASAEVAAAAEAEAAAAAEAMDFSLAPLAIALAVVAAAMIVFSHSGGGVDKAAKDIADSVEKTGQALDVVFRGKVSDAIKGNSDLAAALERSHLSASDMLAAIHAGGPSLDAFIKQLEGGKDSGGFFDKTRFSVGLLGAEYKQATNDLVDYAKAQHAADQANPTEAVIKQAAATQSLSTVLGNAATGSGKFTASLGQLDTAASDAQSSGLDLRDALSDTSDAGIKFQTAIAGVVDGAKQDAVAQLQHGASLAQVQGNLKGAAQAAYDWAVANNLGVPAASALRDSISGLGTNSDIAKAAIDELTSSIQAYLDKINGVKANADQVNTAFNQLAQTAKDSASKGVNLGQAYSFVNGNFKDTSDSAIAYRTALDGVIAKELDHVRAVEQDDFAHQNFTGAVKDAQVALLQAAQRTYDTTLALTGNAQAAADARQKVLDYVGELGTVPPTVSTSVQTPGLDRSLAQAQALADQLAAINGRTFSADVQVNVSSGQAASFNSNDAIAEAHRAGRASGGAVIRGVSYNVGEHGPERFIPNESGTIIPASKEVSDYAARLQPVQVIAVVQLDKQEIARQIHPELIYLDESRR